MLIHHRCLGRPSSAARVRGVITVVQEDRIRLVDAAGRGYLFILDRRVRWSLPDLWRLARERQPVTAVYVGPPDLGAVAIALRVEAD